jgi:hypothetical protein
MFIKIAANSLFSPQSTHRYGSIRYIVELFDSYGFGLQQQYSAFAAWIGIDFG